MTQQNVRIQKRLESKDKTIWGISIILVLGPILIKFLNDFVSNQSKEIFKWELTKIDYAGNFVSIFPFLKGYDAGLLLLANKTLNMLLIVVLVISFISIVKAILEFLLYVKFKSDDKDLYIEKKEDTENINLIHSDKPLNYTTFKEKFLNKDTSEKKLENSESKTTPETIFNNFKNLIKDDNESQVISLTASWGAGKTSFFRIFQGWSEEQKLGYTFYEYNPWMGKTKNLTEDFLNYLKSIIYTETGELIDSQANDYIASLYDNLPNNALTSSIPLFLKKEAISFQITKEKIRQKIELAFLESTLKSTKINFKNRIIILIDNIDRLTHKQILEILELVKDVADFPNITFVLAFDKKAVSTAITEELKTDPGHYLEKIINDEFNLKWAENQNDYIENILFWGFFKSLAVKVQITDVNTLQADSNKCVFSALVVETFRKKYANKLSRQEGLNLVVEGKLRYMSAERVKGWEEFAIFLSKLARQKNRHFDEIILYEDLPIFASDKIKFSMYSGDLLNLDYLLSNNDLYGLIEDYKLGDMLFTIRDRFTIRFMKKFFKEFEKDLAKENKTEFTFVEMATIVRSIVERIW